MKGANYFLFCLLALKLSAATSSSSSSSSSSGTNDTPSVALTRQAIELGMEPAALGELWRTKQPVIVSKPDAQGQLHTTTYTLSPDGQSISKTSSQDQLPSTTPPTQSTPKPAENPQTDWEYLPSSVGNRRTFSLGSSSPFDAHWPSFRGWPSFEFPAGVTPQTSTKTEKDDQGRTVTTTIKTYRGPVGSATWSAGADLKPNWPSFEFPTGILPQTSTKTEQDEQGNTITTRTRTYSGPLFRTWTTLGGEVGGGLPASWQPSTPALFDQGLPPWFKNPRVDGAAAAPAPGAGAGTGFLPAAGELPSLVPTTTVKPVPVPTSPSFPTPQPQNGAYPPLPTAPPNAFGEPLKPVTNINLDELPATKISYRSSFNSVEPPKAAELEPHVREMLNRGGITDDDIQRAKELGNEVVRTRVLPDGRTIKTTVRVNNWTGAAPPAAFAPLAPLAPSPPRDSTIENFLSQVHLTPTDIRNQNGELVKTIVDQNGRVLSVKFVLSDVKGDEGQRAAQEQPTK
ncbi:endochitinase A [Drosophila navojoa]|uniref:endochitinase A n=1 Tax=Drosophila navojoa TaxID=7232 RepID=UPI0011BE04F0|nr:endochitinase A [Drosophila navojoa]